MILRLLGTVGIDRLLLLQVGAVSEVFVQVSGAPQECQNYIKDVRLMRRGPLEDEGISFERRRPAAAGNGAAAAA
jgi:hypothetical protein